jgi:hypothetical protein
MKLQLGRLAATLILPTLVWYSPPLRAQGPQTAPHADDDWLAKTLAFLGIRKPAALEIGRGGDDDPVDASGLSVWVMARDGKGSQRVPAPAGSYRWPVFSPDGDRIASLKDGHLCILGPGSSYSEVPRSPSSPGVARLLSWTTSGIAGVTSDGKTVRFDPQSGQAAVGEPVPASRLPELVLAARTCGDAYVDQSDAAPDAKTGRTRIDLVVQRRSTRGDAGAGFWVGSVVTMGSERLKNMDPSFSADCRRIVFAGK